MADGNTVAVTDWPIRIYGTLKLNPKVYGVGPGCLYHECGGRGGTIGVSYAS